jgi:hypothetical protein
MTEPTFDKATRSWSCPEGFKHPKCRGCGHNYFSVKPQPIEPDGRAVDGGLCHWCLEEQDD